MVGDGRWGMPSRSRRRFSKKLDLGLQGMDGPGPCPGLDQYQNYSRVCLLFRRDPDWNNQTVAG